MGNLKSNMTKEEWSDLQDSVKINPPNFDNTSSDSKITRLEIINHAKNDKPVGRILTLYKELSHFEHIELHYQDDGKTLKIFLS